MISQPESHIFIAGFVQRGEDVVPWHSCAQNYCFEGLDVIYFFFSKLLHDIFIFAVVLGASLLTISKLKYKKVDVTWVLKLGFSNYTDFLLFLEVACRNFVTLLLVHLVKAMWMLKHNQLSLLILLRVKVLSKLLKTLLQWFLFSDWETVKSVQGTLRKRNRLILGLVYKELLLLKLIALGAVYCEVSWHWNPGFSNLMLRGWLELKLSLRCHIWLELKLRWRLYRWQELKLSWCWRRLL